MSFFEPNLNGSSSIYGVDGRYSYATYTSFVDFTSHAAWKSQTPTTQPEFVSNQQHNCWKILEAIQKNKEVLHESYQKSQKELNEYFQRRKDKIEEDWRKHEVEHLERRRKYEEEYRAQQHAYMMSMVFSLPHSSTQYEENNSNVIVEDEPKLEDPHTSELNVNVNSNYSGDLEEFQLVEEIECFDLVVGSKADLEKSQSAQFKLEAEVDNLSAYEHEKSAYIMAEDQGSIAWDLSLIFNSLQEIQPKAENKEGSKFAIKHRWPPP
ncbi:hypothetical protein ACLB2K_040474 [Fragaria x ananassa]